MIKPTLVVLLCLTISSWAINLDKYSLVDIQETEIRELFGLYLTTIAPSHMKPTSARYNYFRSQVQEIIAHNRNPSSTWKRAITKFTGLTMDELEGWAIMEPQHCSATNGISATGDVNIPDYLDWRDAGIVPPVKNQGKCGSCWAFSAVGAIESHLAITQKTVCPLLAEQQLVDCAGDFNNFGCNGGLPSQAFEYIKHVGGIETRIDYPYTAVDGKCDFNKDKVAVQVNYGSANITLGDEKALLEAVANKGPVSIAYQVVAGFKDYSGGVYTSDVCKSDSDSVNHAVLAVGYGYDSKAKMDYWIVKNSWGNTWGEAGYFRIKRGVNMCGVATCASYPQLEKP